MATERSWTIDDEDKFVELWKTYPCLFDSTAKNYSNRYVKREAIGQIALQMERRVDDITRHMTSLRTSYGRTIKCLPHGRGRKPMTVRQDWLLKRLDFLRIYIKARGGSASIKIEDVQPRDNDQESVMIGDDTNENYTYSFDPESEELQSFNPTLVKIEDVEPEDSQQESMITDDKVDDNNGKYTYSFDLESDVHSFNSTSSSGPSQPKKLKPSNTPVTLTLELKRPGPNKRNCGLKKKEELEALKSIAKSLSGPKPVAEPPASDMDDLDLFGKLVTAKLRKIHNVAARLNVCNEIHMILMQSEMSHHDSQ